MRKFQGAKVPQLELSLPAANGLGSEKSSSQNNDNQFQPSVKERLDKLSWPLFLACRKIVCNETEETSTPEPCRLASWCLRLPCICSEISISLHYNKVHRVKLGRATTQSLDAILSPAAGLSETADPRICGSNGDWLKEVTWRRQ